MRPRRQHLIPDRHPSPAMSPKQLRLSKPRRRELALSAAADRRGICGLRFGPFRGSAKVQAAATGQLANLLGYLPDSEVVDPLAGLEFRSKPARRLPSSRPSLGRPVRIPKLRNHGWIRTPPCRWSLGFSFATTLELLQAIFEHTLLRKQRGCKPGGDFFVECPQLIRGH
jgi:hypothetical protein